MAPLKRLRLPYFLNHRNKWGVVPIAATFTIGTYLFANRYHLGEPRLLPYTAIDAAIPFLPWTAWIYVSEYLYAFIVFLLIRDMRNANRFLYSFLSLHIASIAFFLLFPTTFPRELFPLDPSAMGTWTFRIFEAVRAADTPASCFPSLHVSSCVLASFLFLDEQREKFPWFFGWAMAVAVSTLTTKQHYVADVLGGIGMAVLFRRLYQESR